MVERGENSNELINPP